MNLQEKLQQGIIAAKAGRKKAAQAWLLEVVQADESRLQAWLWLSYVSDDLDDKEVCFENILILDPENEFAHKGLAWLTRQRAKSGPPAAGYLTEDEFDNEWLCPYCTAPTAEADRICRACTRPLIIRRREREDRSVWLWRGIFLQLGTISYILIGALGYLMIMARLKYVPNPFIFWPLYLGLPVDGPAGPAAIVRQILPPAFFWLLVGVVVYTLTLVVILYFRVPFGHLLYILNAGVMFVLAIASLLPGNPKAAQCLGGIALGLGVLQVVITGNLWADFTFKENRLRLRVDRDAKTGEAFAMSGRHYAREGLWGQAVIHLRRAVSLQPLESGYHLALTVAYLNIKRYDLARSSLAEAARLKPSAPEVKKLQQQLAAMTADE